MKQIIETDSGVRIQIDNGFVYVTSKSGDTICYDAEGEFWQPVADFFLMGPPERALVRRWLAEGRDERYSERFYKRVYKAFANINYDYQISVLEPSMDIEGYLYFRERHDIITNLTFWDYRELAEEFYCAELEMYDEEWIPYLATDYELTLWYAWRCAAKRLGIKGTMQFDLMKYAKSGTLRYGFADGVCNTLKVVDAGRGCYAVCKPVSDKDGIDFSRPEYYYDQDAIVKGATPVVALRKKK